MSSTELWVATSTVIFIILAWKPLARAIIPGLDHRRQRITHELDEAQRLRAEAEALLAEIRTRHETASIEAEGIVAFARDEAQRLRLHAEEDMKRHIARRERQATDRIAQAEATAIARIKARAVDLALAASSHLLTEKLAEDAGERLIDEAIAALPGKVSAAGG
jgi:F-type H+-transporting ATPase subunit b